MWTRVQLKENAKQAFYRNYWECVAVAFIMGILEFNANVNLEVYHNNMDTFRAVYPSDMWYLMTTFLTTLAAFNLMLTVLGIFLKIFVGNVFAVGGRQFFIQNRTSKTKISTILLPFGSGHYGNVVLTMFLRDLYIGLWMLLLIVPGIIKSYEYLMVPYILADNPGMDRREAFAISKRMMDGEKWNAFVLGLSFVGWALLAACTCGILGLFFLKPHMEATYTELYTYNKIKAYNEGYIR